MKLTLIFCGILGGDEFLFRYYKRKTKFLIFPLIKFRYSLADLHSHGSFLRGCLVPLSQLGVEFASGRKISH
ncbi:hypothetical protein ACHQM5_000445 [Ranunculus cassubicifolius]